MCFNIICKISEINNDFYELAEVFNLGKITYIKADIFANFLTDCRCSKYKKYLKYVDVKEFSKVPNYVFSYCDNIKYLNLNVNKNADEKCSYCGVFNGKMLKYIKLPNFHHSTFFIHNDNIICMKTKLLINNQKYYIPMIHMRINI